MRLSPTGLALVTLYLIATGGLLLYARYGVNSKDGIFYYFLPIVFTTAAAYLFGLFDTLSKLPETVSYIILLIPNLAFAYGIGWQIDSLIDGVSGLLPGRRSGASRSRYRD
jgi:phosphatidylserine synthase